MPIRAECVGRRSFRREVAIQIRAATLRLGLLACLLARTSAFAQGDPGGVAGLLADPSGAALAGVEVVLTGIDVHAIYAARTDAEGHYELSRVAPGAYRVAVRHPDVVPVGKTLRVGAGARITLDIETALQARITLGLGAASAAALRQWASGGPPPARPLEWACTIDGRRCDLPDRVPDTGHPVVNPPAALPMLAPQPLGEILLAALARLDGQPGIVEMTGTIAADGFMSGVSVSSATSPELAAAALAEATRLRWEPARLRGIPVNTSVTLDIRF